MHFKFGAIIEKSGRSFGVFFPDLPGCISAGKTIDAAKEHAVEALTLHLEGMLQDGDEIPAATPLDELVADPDVKEVERILVAAKIPDGTESGEFGETLLEGLDEALRYMRGEKTGVREHLVMVGGTRSRSILIGEFPGILVAGDGWYWVKFPDLPEIEVGGISIEEAKENAEEALMLELEARIDEDVMIPAATLLKDLDPEPLPGEIDRFMVRTEVNPEPGSAGKVQDEEQEEPSIGLRFFVFEPDGTLKHMPIRVADGLTIGPDRLPQYANQRIRVLRVVLWTKNRQPLEVKRLEASIWQFDEAGSVRQFLVNAAFKALETYEALQEEKASETGVVSIEAKRARRRWEEEHRWVPTPAEITRVVHAIWPEQAGGPVKRLQSITGTAKRRLAMSFEAKQALDDCWPAAYDITSKISRLSDKDLKAFMQGVEGKFDPAEPVTTAFWKGIISTAEMEIVVRKARKSTRGKWFAAVDVFTDDPGERGVASGSTIEFRECNGRAAAVAAAREMLAKYAAHFDVGVAIDARLCPEIEWGGPF